MDARAPHRETNWAAKDLSPPTPLDDIVTIDWGSPESFRRQRSDWLRAIRRTGGMSLGPMREICAAIGDHLNPSNTGAFPSHEKLAAELGWSVSSVKRAIALAVAWGWLTKSRRPNTSNLYEMSFSVTARAGYEKWHAERMADFKERVDRRKLAKPQQDAQSGQLRPEPTESSDLTSPLAQAWPVAQLRSDPLTRQRTSSLEPAHSTTVGLGEGELDHTLGEGEQKKTSRDEVISVLGHGDLQAGEQAAATLGPARLGYLVRLVDEDGMVGAHRAILQARNSIAPQH